MNRLIIVLAAAVFVLINLTLYYLYRNTTTFPEPEPAVSEKDSVALSMAIYAAISDYAKDHKGEVPQTLDELFGSYLISNEYTPSDLSRFTYQKISFSTYELREINAPSGKSAIIIRGETSTDDSP
jgi:hypothetical protein